MRCARGHQLRIVALDRRRHHQHVGAGDVFGFVADADADALVAQAGDVGAFGGVRALHRIAEIAQHLGDAAHADAADPDEVDGSDLARQSHEAVPVIARTGCLGSARHDKGKNRGFASFRGRAQHDSHYLLN
jgi:hypothetical protein